MLPIRCIRCHRPYFSASAPRADVRCTVCRGRLEVDLEADAADAPLDAHARPAGTPAPPRAAEGSYRAHPLAYPSLVEFVNEDPRRGASPERDVGLQWRGSDERTYRAAGGRDTGELYLVQTGAPDEGGGHVELLGCAPSEDALWSALAGWQLECGTEHSVSWLTSRARERMDAPIAPLAFAVGGRRLSGRSQDRPSVLRAGAPSMG